MYKNIAKQEKLLLKNLVDYQAGQVVSKTLVQNELVSVTVCSFEKDEEISTHASGGDAMVTVLEGTGRFTVGGEVWSPRPTNFYRWHSVYRTGGAEPLPYETATDTPFFHKNRGRSRVLCFAFHV